MTDTQLNINPDEITGVLRRHLEGFRPDVEKQQVGRIIEVGDGIARISGLPSTAVNELLESEGGVLGLAVNLDEDSIGAGVLGDIEHIEEGKSAKSAVAVDTIINQRGQGVKCIYVAIGQKGSSIAEIVASLEEHGALEYTVVVAAPAAEPAPFKYLAPYAGCAMGQHWMDEGDAALIVYDDLSKQAEAYRQLSL